MSMALSQWAEDNEPELVLDLGPGTVWSNAELDLLDNVNSNDLSLVSSLQGSTVAALTSSARAADFYADTASSEGFVDGCGGARRSAREQNGAAGIKEPAARVGISPTGSNGQGESDSPVSGGVRKSVPGNAKRGGLATVSEVRKPTGSRVRFADDHATQRVQQAMTPFMQDEEYIRESVESNVLLQATVETGPRVAQGMNDTEAENSTDAQQQPELEKTTSIRTINEALASTMEESPENVLLMLNELESVPYCSTLKVIPANIGHYRNHLARLRLNTIFPNRRKLDRASEFALRASKRRADTVLPRDKDALSLPSAPNGSMYFIREKQRKAELESRDKIAYEQKDIFYTLTSAREDFPELFHLFVHGTSNRRRNSLAMRCLVKMIIDDHCGVSALGGAGAQLVRKCVRDLLKITDSELLCDRVTLLLTNLYVHSALMQTETDAQPARSMLLSTIGECVHIYLNFFFAENREVSVIEAAPPGVVWSRDAWRKSLVLTLTAYRSDRAFDLPCAFLLRFCFKFFQQGGSAEVGLVRNILLPRMRQEGLQDARMRGTMLWFFERCHTKSTRREIFDLVIDYAFDETRTFLESTRGKHAFDEHAFLVQRDIIKRMLQLHEAPETLAFAFTRVLKRFAFSIIQCLIFWPLMDKKTKQLAELFSLDQTEMESVAHYGYIMSRVARKLDVDVLTNVLGEVARCISEYLDVWKTAFLHDRPLDALLDRVTVECRLARDLDIKCAYPDRLSAISAAFARALDGLVTQDGTETADEASFLCKLVHLFLKTCLLPSDLRHGQSLQKIIFSDAQVDTRIHEFFSGSLGLPDFLFHKDMFDVYNLQRLDRLLSQLYKRALVSYSMRQEISLCRKFLSALLGEISADYCSALWKDRDCQVAAMAAEYYVDSVRRDSVFYDRHKWLAFNRSILQLAQQSSDLGLAQDPLFFLEQYEVLQDRMKFDPDGSLPDDKSEQLSFKSL
ncbi:hypothetical protein FVE85_1840 [Porphyridium purpureum]|uniref:Uncharacterized protein n=1 Tax=Porphyridium purpureum TaxID=35688 RepID=A0A5J4YWX8_PORPP|nr:hypothetical protein FVE85_1840 [Porphyridium purpureum]|eukprot:POR5244..scf209_3